MYESQLAFAAWRPSVCSPNATPAPRLCKQASTRVVKPSPNLLLLQRLPVQSQNEDQVSSVDGRHLGFEKERLCLKPEAHTGNIPFPSFASWADAGGMTEEELNHAEVLGSWAATPLVSPPNHPTSDERGFQNRNLDFTT